MNLKQILCENISRRRKKLGISQAALAERLHISPEAMTRIEKGTIAPKLSRLDSIARNLQCTVLDLFRPYSEEKSDHVTIIADAISGLSPDAKDAIVHIVLETSRVLSNRCEKD